MYDLIIIGAGTAGINAYEEARKHTQNILIINEGLWDTTCARVGCMPSKALISSANRLYEAQHIEQVGIKTKSSFDTSKVIEHMWTLRDHFTRVVTQEIESWPTQHRLSGKATFINATTVEVNQKSYQAKSFIIAVGSKPVINQEWKNILKDRFITSDEVFDLKSLPSSMAVIGSGAIALELAQAFARLGVKVTIFARSHKIGILTSPELQQQAQRKLAEEMNIKFETLPTRVNRTHDQVEIYYEVNNEKKIEQFDYLLNATGRSTLLDSLALEKIDTAFKDTAKLPINEKTKQLANLPIFIAGDAHTKTPVQHEAAQEGKKLVQNCLNYPEIATVKTLTPLSIVFSSPEMAIAGQSYKQLKEANTEFVRGIASFENQGRALVLGKNIGGAEVYIDKNTRQILGVELLVSSAEHLAHLLTWMISRKLTVDEILEMPFYHPTLEEGIRTALKQARRALG